MKILYFECGMGAAGDMLMGAMYDLLTEEKQAEFREQMNSLGPSGIQVTASREQKCGVYGSHMHIHIHGTEEGAHSHEHHHEHHQGEGHTHSHTDYHGILHQISHLNLPEEVKKDTASVYKAIGEAEAKVHQTTLEQIHFHEVGTLDALADVAGCCLLIHMLQPEQILASPIHVGSGTVHCAHGILPVPAPATAELLRGIPIYSGAIQGELCTPTGAALLKHFVSSFEPLPPMTLTGTGYGMGTKDFPQANCVRALLGSTADAAKADIILSLSCNLDDMTGEALAFAMEQLMEQGALDVYTTPIGMKKGRPGQLFTCLCQPLDEARMTQLMFLHTSTRGIRVQEYRRHVMTSSFERRATPLGEITLKQSQGYGLTREKPEYEDISRLAREHGISLEAVLKNI